MPRHGENRADVGVERLLQRLKRHDGVVRRLAFGQLPAIDCSPSRINQVVFNLVHNALDACSPGNKVTVNTVAAGNAVEIHVSDTGHGIAPEIRDKIFDPFVSTKREGVGLGLVNTRSIVESHGGSVRLTPRPGRGTCVTISLPRCA